MMKIKILLVWYSNKNSSMYIITFNPLCNGDRLYVNSLLVSLFYRFKKLARLNRSSVGIWNKVSQNSNADSSQQAAGKHVYSNA